MKILVNITNKAGFTLASEVVEFTDLDVKIIGVHELHNVAKRQVLSKLFTIETQIIEGLTKNYDGCDEN
jgi:hypothetical protein